MRVRRFRGLSLKYYLALTVFSVASSFYIFDPVRKELERRNMDREQKSALKIIEASRKLE